MAMMGYQHTILGRIKADYCASWASDENTGVALVYLPPLRRRQDLGEMIRKIHSNTVREWRIQLPRMKENRRPG